MKKKSNAGYFFRLLFVPAMFIYAMIEFTWVRSCALGVMAAWFAYWFMQTVNREEKKKVKQEEKEKKADQSETEAFMLSQVNQRITERLAQAFPMVEWSWLCRPDREELQTGGSWCIRLFRAEPYTYAEVILTETGEMKITMLVPADDASEEKPEEESTEEPKQCGAGEWYNDYAGDLLATMIDNLNAQGYKRLTIHEDGEVYVQMGKKEIAVDKLEWFLPRRNWSEISDLLKEDGIRAAAEESGLMLKW